MEASHSSSPLRSVDICLNDWIGAMSRRSRSYHRYTTFPSFHYFLLLLFHDTAYFFPISTEQADLALGYCYSVFHATSFNHTTAKASCQSGGGFLAVLPDQATVDSVASSAGRVRNNQQLYGGLEFIVMEPHKFIQSNGVII